MRLRGLSNLVMLLAGLLPAEAFGARCDDATHKNFIYDPATNTCSCAGGEIVNDWYAAPGVPGSTCVHQNLVVVQREVYLIDQSTAANTQAAAQQEAWNVNRLGSAGAATVAIGVCAQGANKAVKDKEAGGVVLGGCLDALEAAKKLKDAELIALKNLGQEGHSPELEADPKGLTGLQREFRELEENYGLSKDEFVKGALQSRGDRDAFGRLLRRQFTAEAFQNTLSAAAKLSEERRRAAMAAVRMPEAPKDQEHLYNMAGAGPRSGLQSLRDDLQSLRGRSIASEEAVPSNAAGAEDAGGMTQFLGLSRPKPGMTGLHPMDTASMAKEAGAAEASFAEITLFDVVHRKYRSGEFAKRIAPLRLLGNR